MRKLSRRRYLTIASALGLLGTAVIGVSFAAVTAGGNAPATVCERAATPSVTAEPKDIIPAFLYVAVLRKRPALAWQLMTPALRSGSTCRGFLRGYQPVQALPKIDGYHYQLIQPQPRPGEDSSSYWQRATASGDLTYAVQVEYGSSTSSFLLQLVRAPGGPWLVNSFTPDITTMPALSPPVMPQ